MCNVYYLSLANQLRFHRFFLRPANSSLSLIIKTRRIILAYVYRIDNDSFASSRFYTFFLSNVEPNRRKQINEWPTRFLCIQWYDSVIYLSKCIGVFMKNTLLTFCRYCRLVGISYSKKVLCYAEIGFFE